MSWNSFEPILAVFVVLCLGILLICAVVITAMIVVGSCIGYRNQIDRELERVLKSLLDPGTRRWSRERRER